MTKAEIQLVRALADKRGRTEHGLFVAEGEKLIGELRASQLRVRKMFALEGIFEGPEVETVSRHDMERLSLLKTAGNSLALVEIPRYELDLPELGNDLTLALDDVQNPGNLGTIVRLADWFGIRDILCSEATADCFNPKVVQATMGAILRVRVHYVDLKRVLREAAARGVAIYGTFLEGDDLYDAPLTRAGIVVMGNEGRGVTPEVAAAVTHRLFIPPYPAGRRTTESLNVAMATGIVCAEFRRRKL
ncbi:MAG: RNA methyltransferase [Alistipes sp.]|nr:RNA methyltransferase [Alistipes senegalensis]MCM1249859.1 RNA methyltransferase [Alistipes sp.]